MISKLILPVLLLSTVSFAKDGLVNVYSFYSEIYGGTEDGGIQRTETYIFVAQQAVLVSEPAFVDGRKFTLHKGDSLQISQEHFIPYNPNDGMIDSLMVLSVQSPVKLTVPPNYTFFEKGRTVYIHLDGWLKWNHELTYTIRKQTYAAKTKAEFDTGYSHAAP